MLPMIHARGGDRLYLHTSTGSGLSFQAPTEVCVAVSFVDGLVLAMSQLHPCLKYRASWSGVE